MNAQNVEVISHSHNDYEQEHPLTTALELGFNSIEIDILLHKNELIVTHNSFDLDSKPKIEELYFQPLRQMLQYPSKVKWLLIDLKDYNIETLNVLHTLAQKYDDLFATRVEINQDKPIQILLSGDLPRKEIIDNPKMEILFY